MSLNRYGGGSSGAAADLADHLNDTVDAHDASAISFAPTGTVAATTVQAAIAEVSADVSDILDGTTLTGPLVLPDGSAAAPSLRIGDEQNGLYSQAANQLGMTLNGVLRYSFVGETDYRVLGIGSAPTQWGGAITPVNVLELGDASALMATTAQLYAMQNVKYNSSYNLVYRANGAASYINLSNSQINFYVAPSGTAGNTATFTNPLQVAESAVSVTGTLAVNSNNISADNGLGFRNRIINGACLVNQRLAGTISLGAAFSFSADRWSAYEETDGTATFQISTATPPAGFAKFQRYTVTSADATLAATQRALIQYIIEGSDVADLDWGLSTAKTITLSFYVRSSVAGAYSGNLSNSAANRCYPFSYTIDAANTWERKTVTIAGDTSGTWLTDNGIGVRIRFTLGSGSSLVGTAGAWGASFVDGVTGTTNLMATNGATFDMTGLQFEVGSVATPFERRAFVDELVRCQRYYEKSYDYATAPAAVTASGSVYLARYNASASDYGTVYYKVNKRAAVHPTMYSPSTGASGNIRNLSAGADAATSANNPGEWCGSFTFTAAAGAPYAYHWVTSAEL